MSLRLRLLGAKHSTGVAAAPLRAPAAITEAVTACPRPCPVLAAAEVVTACAVATITLLAAPHASAAAATACACSTLHAPTAAAALACASCCCCRCRCVRLLLLLPLHAPAAASLCCSHLWLLHKALHLPVLIDHDHTCTHSTAQYRTARRGIAQHITRRQVDQPHLLVECAKDRCCSCWLRSTPCPPSHRTQDVSSKVRRPPTSGPLHPQHTWRAAPSAAQHTHRTLKGRPPL